MSRKIRAPRRDILADPKFHSPLVARFINTIMHSGKKSVAEGIVYKMFDIVGEKSAADPLEVFRRALENVKPTVEVKSRRVGGANYQVPIPVSGERRTTLAIRWIKTATRAKKGKRMAEKLADE